MFSMPFRVCSAREPAWKRAEMGLHVWRVFGYICDGYDEARL